MLFEVGTIPAWMCVTDVCPQLAFVNPSDTRGVAEVNPWLSTPLSTGCEYSVLQGQHGSILNVTILWDAALNVSGITPILPALPALTAVGRGNSLLELGWGRPWLKARQWWGCRS